MSISAMKQALEALEFFCEYGVIDRPFERIAELKQAIAEAEKQEPDDLARVGEVGVWGDKREWVGLTKDDVDSWELPVVPTVFQFAQFVEAKLKEKNT